MKTVGGVVIAKLLTDRTEIEGKIDEFLSAKWSTWNTLRGTAIDFPYALFLLTAASDPGFS